MHIFVSLVGFLMITFGLLCVVAPGKLIGLLEKSKTKATAFATAVEQGSGRPTPPTERVGFGRPR